MAGAVGNSGCWGCSSQEDAQGVEGCAWDAAVMHQVLQSIAGGFCPPRSSGCCWVGFSFYQRGCRKAQLCVACGKSVLISLLMEHNPAEKGALLLTAKKFQRLLSRRTLPAPLPTLASPTGILPGDWGTHTVCQRPGAAAQHCGRGCCCCINRNLMAG